MLRQCKINNALAQIEREGRLLSRVNATGRGLNRSPIQSAEVEPHARPKPRGKRLLYNFFGKDDSIHLDAQGATIAGAGFSQLSFAQVSPSTL